LIPRQLVRILQLPPPNTDAMILCISNTGIFLLQSAVDIFVVSNFLVLGKDSLCFKQGFGSALILYNADPDTDPDPAFFLIADPDSGSRIRIQGLMMKDRKKL
jgi:hypothetical protein